MILSRMAAARLEAEPVWISCDEMPRDPRAASVINMPFQRLLCLLVFPVVLQAAAPQRGMGALVYRVKLRMQGEATAIETRFSLIPTPVAATANRVKKSRMGAWRLEAHQPKDAAFSQAMVLAQVERMLYFSGPMAGVAPRDLVVHFGDKPCQVWAAKIPSGVNAYAYLAEVAPGLLALSYFSGSFSGGDLATLEIQLESFHLEAGAAPAEQGTALVNTLNRMVLAQASPQTEGEAQLVP